MVRRLQNISTDLLSSESSIILKKITKKKKKRKGDNSMENGQRIQKAIHKKDSNSQEVCKKRCSSRLVIREMKI